MAGPRGDQFRILVAFLEPVDENSASLQSFILDTDRVKKQQQPSSFYLDLTATIRNLQTGAKNQKILVQRWERSGDVEVKCEGGKWIKQASGPELDKIVGVVNAVVRIVPFDAKETTEFTLTKDVEQSVRGLLNALNTSKLQCVRNGTPD